MPLIHFSSAIF